MTTNFPLDESWTDEGLAEILSGSELEGKIFWTEYVYHHVEDRDEKHEPVPEKPEWLRQRSDLQYATNPKLDDPSVITYRVDGYSENISGE